jgi:hypothetical protein
VIASVWDLAASAPWSFLIGGIVGFALGASFTITRKNGPHD